MDNKQNDETLEALFRGISKSVENLAKMCNKHEPIKCTISNVWKAEITDNGVITCLGYYNTSDEARQAIARQTNTNVVCKWT